MWHRDSVTLGVFCVTLFLLSCPSAARAQDLKGAVEQLARDLGNSVPEGRMLTVAVSDFPDLQGGVSDLGRYVSERLVTRLSARPEKFRVIERRRLDQVLSELRFNLTDLVDPAKAEQLGKMLGAQAIVVGTLSDLGNNVDIDARIIEIGTSSTLPGVSVTLSKDDTVRQLLERGRQMAGYGGASPGGASPLAPASGSSTGFYESSELRIDVDSIKVVENGILVNIRYTNRRPNAIAISLSPRDNSPINLSTRAADELGNSHRLDRLTVIGSNPRVLQPGIPVSATFTFYKDGAPGKLFSLTSDIDIFEVDGEGNILDRIKTLRVLVQNVRAGR